MSSNKDFLPSSSPISSVCAIEIEAILFLFMMNCYKSSFQECITIIVLKIEPTMTSRHIVYFSYKKKRHSASPGRVVVGLPSPSSRICTDGRTYADVRTKILRINGLPNLLTYGAPRAPVKQMTPKVSCQSFLNHGNFSAGLYIKQKSSRGSLQRFFSSSLNRSIILPFSELMEREPLRHLVLNCLHSGFAVEHLPIHFLRVSRRNVTVEKSSITVPVSGVCVCVFFL